MTKGQAIQNFFENFALSVYSSASVPEDAVMPYLTYDCVLDGQFAETSIQVNLWYYSSSEVEANAKAEEIGEVIDTMYPLPCDKGLIWLKRGSPWCQALYDEASDKVKRRLLNVTAEFMTTH